MRHMLSQRRASEIWGVSRRTIQRAIQSGKLSISLDGQIDPSEMLRVFGEASSKKDGGAGAPVSEPLAPPNAPGEPPSSEAALSAEIKALRAALVAKDELLAAKDRHIEDMSLSLRLLAAPISQPQPPSQARKRNQTFWQRIFGKTEKTQ
ncbi:hypothetical protein [Gluconobacter japonicus]|nr:hypothetical protein [Gluconobacter japonicus]GBR24820.1 hypothetical protein AA3271_1878 [Gluconobacter japonicus NBRC 3271]